MDMIMDQIFKYCLSYLNAFWDIEWHGLKIIERNGHFDFISMVDMSYEHIQIEFWNDLSK